MLTLCGWPLGASQNVALLTNNTIFLMMNVYNLGSLYYMYVDTMVSRPTGNCLQRNYNENP